VCWSSLHRLFLFTKPFRFSFGLANLPDVLVKIRSHSASKSKTEYKPALLVARKLQCFMWNERLESRGINISQGALSYLLKPVGSSLSSREEIHRSIECLESLCQSFINQEIGQYCEKFYMGQDELVEQKQILTLCVEEIANRYVFQLLSASRKCDPLFPIPSVYLEQFNNIQSAQLRSSILNFVS
jgi:hypothetical protein